MIELKTRRNHMTCLCRKQFCYLCRATWKTSSCTQWDEYRLDVAVEQVDRMNINDGARAGNRLAAPRHAIRPVVAARPVPMFVPHQTRTLIPPPVPPTQAVPPPRPVTDAAQVESLRAPQWLYNVRSASAGPSSQHVNCPTHGARPQQPASSNPIPQPAILGTQPRVTENQNQSRSSYGQVKPQQTRINHHFNINASPQAVRTIRADAVSARTPSRLVPQPPSSGTSKSRKPVVNPPSSSQWT
ncbi:hypothetical protein M422DRAFT_243896 [Sphaerobolus stellatus SS14]|nr:hypothetical protein M422DRAFT_243896 [Sphaerobolus stellatus SS14]